MSIYIFCLFIHLYYRCRFSFCFSVVSGCLSLLTDAHFSPLQILSSQHISLPPPIWVCLQPPSQITSSLRAPTARCREERRPRPAPALLASSVTGSTKTSSPSTAPSWLPWWWDWWLTLFLRGQLVQKKRDEKLLCG